MIIDVSASYDLNQIYLQIIISYDEKRDSYFEELNKSTLRSIDKTTVEWDADDVASTVSQNKCPVTLCTDVQWSYSLKLCK